MALNYVAESLGTMGNDMMAEALWPTQVSSAIDVFPTDRYESDSRLKGTLDLDGYTSRSEYPLICWKCIAVNEDDAVYAQTRMVTLVVRVKLAVAGVEDIDDGSNTAAHLTLVNDLAKAQAAIRATMVDSRNLDGPFGLADAALIGGKGSGRTYCAANVRLSEPTIEKAPAGEGEGEDEYGADDRLGFDVWIGEFDCEIDLYVF